MKALEILYTLISSGNNDVFANKNTYEKLTSIAEAIEELEDLENRSCDNCKYWFYKTLETNIETCNFGLISHDYESDSFCCNKWEKE